MDYGGVTDSVVMDETDSHLGDTPALVSLSTPSIRTYLACECLVDLSQRGTVTSDHVIRIKHFGMILGGKDGPKKLPVRLQTMQPATKLISTATLPMPRKSRSCLIRCLARFMSPVSALSFLAFA